MTEGERDNRNEVTIRLSHSAVHVASLEPLDVVIKKAERIVSRIKIIPAVGDGYE